MPNRLSQRLVTKMLGNIIIISQENLRSKEYVLIAEPHIGN